MKSRICNKFLQTSDCGFIIQDEEFEDGFVYIYVFQLKPIAINKLRNNNTYNQVFIRTSESQDIKCTIRKDGHYVIQVCKVPDYMYINDKFMSADQELTIQDIIDLFSYEQYNYFSICWLRQCFINICKSIFDSRASLDCNKVNINEDITYKRDLVWGAINVIQYLVEMEQYREAERILERITGCNGLCDNFDSKKGGGCGCG